MTINISRVLSLTLHLEKREMDKLQNLNTKTMNTERILLHVQIFTLSFWKKIIYGLVFSGGMYFCCSKLGQKCSKKLRNRTRKETKPKIWLLFYFLNNSGFKFCGGGILP